MATGYTQVWTKNWASLRIFYSTSYDAATNASTVTITPQFKSQYNCGTDYRVYDAIYNNTAGIYFNGVMKWQFSQNYGSGNYLKCGAASNTWANLNQSFSYTVQHDSSGSASFTVGILGSVRHFYNGGAVATPVGGTASETIYLQENAASSISSYSSSAATQGTFSLSVSRRNASNYHIATFRQGNTTLYTSNRFDSSLSFTVPRTWFSGYPTSTSLSVAVSVQTYNSAGTAIGSAAAATFTVTADSGMKPAVSSGWASLAPYNTGAVSGMSGYVKGYSKAQATFDPSKITNAAGASVASYSVTCQGSTDSSSPYLTPVLNSTSVSVVCTVTDSRGRSASQSFTLSVYDYAKPSLSGISVYRCTYNGTAGDDGTWYSVKATVSYSSLGGQNGRTLSCARKASDGDYSSETALTSGAASILGTISPDKSYTVRITARDSLGNSVVYYASIPSRKWAMKFRADGSGVAFGKAAELNNALDLPSTWTTAIDGTATGGDGYCKMPDGTLLQWGSKSISREAGSNTANATFALAFVSDPQVFASYMTGHPEIWHYSVANKSTTGCTLELYNEGSSASGGATIFYFAVGRWK